MSERCGKQDLVLIDMSAHASESASQHPLRRECDHFLAVQVQHCPQPPKSTRLGVYAGHGWGCMHFGHSEFFSIHVIEWRSLPGVYETLVPMV